MYNPGILLIDDNKDRIQQFEIILAFLECTGRSIVSQDFSISQNNFDDINAIFVGGGDKQGVLIKELTEKLPTVPVFLLVDKNSQGQISSTIQKMVTKVLLWPTTHPVLNEILSHLAKPEKAIDKQHKDFSKKGLAGNTQLIKQIRKLIDQVAKSDATVLILGESGTGKEVIAQALHRNSMRKNKPFVPVNCGAIPGELLESELFGHEKGAFTGALTARQGRFEMAEGGTLFLDEIGDMPMPMQVKLLRVLQERTFERLGSNKPIQCNIRIIAATHRHLENEIKEQRFREDLFYRLNVFPIEVPALRDRTEDIPYLINDLIDRMTASKKVSIKFSAKAIALLMQHDWPGNVRELANLIERSAIIKPDGIVEVEDLPEKFQTYKIPDGILDEILTKQKEMTSVPTQPTVSAASTKAHLPEKGLDLKEYLSDLESDLINQALNECNGVVAHAAKLLNMRRTTLVEKLRKYELGNAQ